MIAYPAHVADVQTALRFAKTMGKKVVARSGGHNYCGKSSGAQDTIALSMDAFNTAERLGDGRLAVGTGVRLTDLSAKLKKWKVSIPHGECPRVAVGGHVQSGGYGFFLRSFGLALDYVDAFDIVLADGSFKTIARPQPNVLPTTDEEKLNDELFRGVLGGNAGSFGIITKYIFNAIKDEDHPCSYGMRKIRKYNRVVFKDLLKEMQRWTECVANKDEENLKGLGFELTVGSGKYFLPPLMIAEIFYSDPNKNVPYQGQLDAIVQKANENRGFLDKTLFALMSSQGQKKLSKLADAHVDRFPVVTFDGREFKEPYKKRFNITIKALSNEFIDRFSAKLDDVLTKEKGISLVMQCMPCGGAFREKGNDLTAIPGRDDVFNFSFDLFYKPGREARAVALQEEMQQIVDTCFHEDSHERRYFTFSFGDTDITKPEIRKMYYPDETAYKRLQNLKAVVDPDDLFHTSLTVKLPNAF